MVKGNIFVLLKFRARGLTFKDTYFKDTCIKHK